jgi:hypothetical protein
VSKSKSQRNREWEAVSRSALGKYKSRENLLVENRIQRQIIKGCIPASLVAQIGFYKSVLQRILENPNSAVTIAGQALGTPSEQLAYYIRNSKGQE